MGDDPETLAEIARLQSENIILRDNARLRSTLRRVQSAIEQGACDTLWMPDACPETVCDFIEAALGENSSGTT